MLKEKYTLAKLKEELERRKGKLCFSYKKFRRLACNCRKEGEKGTTVPQNKFEVLSSRVMQCGVKERIIRRQEIVEVECFKCREKGHKCRECSLWKTERKMRVEGEVAYMATPQEA